MLLILKLKLNLLQRDPVCSLLTKWPEGGARSLLSRALQWLPASDDITTVCPLSAATQ